MPCGLQDLFAETHIIRDEASLVPPAVDYSYSRIDAAMVDGRRPAVYDYDDAQVCMPPLFIPKIPIVAAEPGRMLKPQSCVMLGTSSVALCRFVSLVSL